MVLILDTTFPTRGQGYDFDRRADLDSAECRRSHAPSARTLARLGFLPALARPRFMAQPAVRPTRRLDDVSPEWRPL